MQVIKRLIFLIIVAVLAACGGGGGSGGTVGGEGTGGGGSGAAELPNIVLSLLNADNSIVSDNSLSGGKVYVVQAVVKNKSGSPVANQLVTFAASDTALINFNPASTITDAQGVAKVGVSVIASGAASLTATVSVDSVNAQATIAFRTVLQPPVQIPTNIKFISVTPQLLVISSAPSGDRSAIAKFQVVSDVGTGVAGQGVVFTLSSQAKDAGVAFSVAGAQTTQDVSATTDASGNAQISVVAGPFPTPVVVTASLAANPAVKAATSQLSVTNGKASQGRLSLSAELLSVEAAFGTTGQTDGVSSNVIMRVADRLANPIPAGTAINFVASHGLVVGSCVTDVTSACTVKWNTQGPRPANGFVTILAYMDGEESFVDLNGNNRYDQNEIFQDLGQLYLDRDADQKFSESVDQIVSNDSANNKACAVTGPGPYGIANRCDAAWSDSVRVRSGVIVSWASSNARIELISANPLNRVFTVLVSSYTAVGNEAGVPTGSAFGASWVSCPTGTTAPSEAPRLSIDKQPNSPYAQPVTISYGDPLGCSLSFTVTSPGGTKTEVVRAATQL